MGFFKPQSARRLAEFFTDLCKKWDALSPAEKATREFVNPDEPVVLHVPNPEWDGPGEAGEAGEAGEYGEDDDGNPREAFFHVLCIGGGDDTDEDGTECGHDGASIGGMEIDQDNYLFNGRKLGTKPKYKLPRLRKVGT